jgi:predicted Rossmann fold flavoprotein
MNIGVIGGGAAGFFAAIQCKLHHPDAQVTILEKSSKLLAKVKISGGGRCNVTNVESDPIKLASNYPRGERHLKKAFREFNTTDTIRFFEERGVSLVAQEDGCVFPKSQRSESIIQCFLDEAIKLGITIKLQQNIAQINCLSPGFEIITSGEDKQFFEKLIICTGGSPKRSGLEWMEKLGQPIIDPFPSLFTFNMPGNPICSLMGVVVENAIARIPGTKLVARGPLLITHWGMSGPAILVLSAWGARELAHLSYQFNVAVNWVGEMNEEKVRGQLAAIQNAYSESKIKKFGVLNLTQRLWEFLLEKYEVPTDKRWKELSKKEFNVIVNFLTNDGYSVNGKTTFKEEFVTAGGVDLNGVNFKTMESKYIPGIHFAGEVLDIDGITGGFNFQAAWTTAYLAGKGIRLISKD